MGKLSTKQGSWKSRGSVSRPRQRIIALRGSYGAVGEFREVLGSNKAGEEGNGNGLELHVDWWVGST